MYLKEVNDFLILHCYGMLDLLIHLSHYVLSAENLGLWVTCTELSSFVVTGLAVFGIFGLETAQFVSLD